VCKFGLENRDCILPDNIEVSIMLLGKSRRGTRDGASGTSR
jgi:hypothetical protein